MRNSHSIVGRTIFCLIFPLALVNWRTADAALLQGCDFGEELCEADEVCIPDGLFGQCYSDPEAALVRPLILDRSLTDAQSELLHGELGRLAELGLDWPHARAQCVLAYFKLAIAFQLDYDTEFCSVRNPANIWALVQRVQNAMLAEQEEQPIDEGQSLLVDGEGQAEEEEQTGGNDQEGEEEEEQVLMPVLLLDGPSSLERDAYQIVTKNATKRGEPDDIGTNEKLSSKEEEQLDQMVQQMLANKAPGNGAAQLNDRQLGKLVNFIRQLQNVLQENVVHTAEEEAKALSAENVVEQEQEAPSAAEKMDQQVLLLKKDSEQFDNADMGLANTVHKIVKGGIQRVEGNRVYLRLAKERMTEDELYKLIGYLDRKIAAPNHLYFDQFLYEDGQQQLSFRISRLPELQTKPDQGLDSASGVAQAVYKRRKDIQTLAGVSVDETGIGSGEDVVPVERSQRDRLFLPILAVCAMTICALLSVLAHTVINRVRRRKSGGKGQGPLLPQTVAEAKCGVMYEDLCRQRAAEAGPNSVAVVGGATGRHRSNHSSTSSWPGDDVTGGGSAPTELDIGTGHVLLSFLQRHLENPGEISRQWDSVRDYAPVDVQCQVAKAPENSDKNLDQSVLPYDESRVQLQAKVSTSPIVELAQTEEAGQANDYVNASKIFDSDPAQPAYLAAQAPSEGAVPRFWQMVWEQGIAVLVNLCDQTETKTGQYAKYWPDEGSLTFGPFEVHLVSEHIWSEHYVVRSLYLKNTGTQETRTITQFHFLSWPVGKVPSTSKVLLEFRRKINKSYRGRASAVLVHCTNGGGRTGTYILIDMTINRIQKGVKELNIAASLEHLRDQRMGMVENEEQFQFVFSCVAEEVNFLLKGLQH